MPEPSDSKYVCYPESLGRYSEFPQHREHRPEGMMGYYNLHLVFEGQGYVELDGERIMLSEGEGFLYPKGADQQYGANPAQPWDVRWVHFSTAMPLPMLGSADETGVWLFSITDRNRLASLMDEMCMISSHFETRYEPRLSALLYELLAELAHNAVSLQDDAIPRHKQQELIREAADRIRERCGESWTLESMAALSGYSMYYFLRLFQTIMGKTPNRYLTDCRMAAAKGLLVATRLPVSQVAERVGFTQSSYFIRVFHSQEGMPPKAYRELYGSLA
ncbi:helix-turn-helix transcriptional regulator [Paenibacillus gorillae]|uniref:helix-turn-helix transcriptional regulator n=1 Tax=Paenibacillus gorillae TaxID=1243662 RepID=UPI0004B66240|nr:AraC family transcriptional regulator [Paenibacillus gorillae]